MKLYLVRHGQSTGNVGGMLTGQSCYPLTELGEAQARAAAARLGQLDQMPVYHSDLPRAVATAEYIALAWSKAPCGMHDPGGDLATAAAHSAVTRVRCSVLVPDPRLREMDLGGYEGRPWEEFEADEVLTARFAEDPYRTALPGGESVAHVEARAVAVVRDILATHGESDGSGVDPAAVTEGSAVATGLVPSHPGENACIVAHDGPIRAILNHYLGVPPEKWWTLSTSHGGISLLEFCDGWVNVRYVNATSHLAGLGTDDATRPADTDTETDEGACPGAAG